MVTLRLSINLVGVFGMVAGKSVGSGTIIDEDGTILTCAHVVVDSYGMRSSPKGKVCVYALGYHSNI